jgi:hypothetical protein
MGWIVTVLSLCAAPLAAPAVAGDRPPGTLPGDEALSCEQIYEQGMAESQREQQERDRKNDERKAQAQGMKGLIIAATAAQATPAAKAAGIAANTAAQNMADKTVAELGDVPPTNARKERLRQLWTQKQCTVKK